MYFHGKVRGFLRTVTEAECGQHVAFCRAAYACTPSLSAFLVYLFPQMTFRALYFLGFRVGVYFLENHFNLFQFQVDDVVHQPLGQLHMFLEQIEIEIGFRRERVDHVSIKVDGQQAATVIRAERYLAARIRTHGTETEIGIAVGYGFAQNRVPE